MKRKNCRGYTFLLLKALSTTVGSEKEVIKKRSHSGEYQSVQGSRNTEEKGSAAHKADRWHATVTTISMTRRRGKRDLSSCCRPALTRRSPSMHDLPLLVLLLVLSHSP